MRETKRKQIGERGYTYHVAQFGARQGGRVLVRLLKMLGGAAGEAMQNDSDGFDMATIGRLVSGLASGLEEADYDWLVGTFIPATAVSGGTYQNKAIQLDTEGVFDLHFAGSYGEMGKWLLFAIEVNFGNFLGENGIIKKAQEAVTGLPDSPADNGVGMSPSRSPNTSAMSGASGA